VLARKLARRNSAQVRLQRVRLSRLTPCPKSPEVTASWLRRCGDLMVRFGRSWSFLRKKGRKRFPIPLDLCRSS
jgi:hypothetical protein